MSSLYESIGNLALKQIELSTAPLRVPKSRPLPEYINVIGNWSITNRDMVIIGNDSSQNSIVIVDPNKYVEFGKVEMYPAPIRMFFDKNVYYVRINPKKDTNNYTYSFEIQMDKVTDTNGVLQKYEGWGAFTLAYNPTAATTSKFLNTALAKYPTMHLDPTNPNSSDSNQIKVALKSTLARVDNKTTLRISVVDYVNKNEEKIVVLEHEFEKIDDQYGDVVPEDPIIVLNKPENSPASDGIISNVQLVSSTRENMFYKDEEKKESNSSSDVASLSSVSSTRSVVEGYKGGTSPSLLDKKYYGQKNKSGAFSRFFWFYVEKGYEFSDATGTYHYNSSGKLALPQVRLWEPINSTGVFTDKDYSYYDPSISGRSIGSNITKYDVNAKGDISFTKIVVGWKGGNSILNQDKPYYGTSKQYEGQPGAMWYWKEKGWFKWDIRDEGKGHHFISTPSGGEMYSEDIIWLYPPIYDYDPRSGSSNDFLTSGQISAISTSDSDIATSAKSLRKQYVDHYMFSYDEFKSIYWHGAVPPDFPLNVDINSSYSGIRASREESTADVNSIISQSHTYTQNVRICLGLKWSLSIPESHSYPIMRITRDSSRNIIDMERIGIQSFTYPSIVYKPDGKKEILCVINGKILWDYEVVTSGREYANGIKSITGKMFANTNSGSIFVSYPYSKELEDYLKDIGFPTLYRKTLEDLYNAKIYLGYMLYMPEGSEILKPTSVETLVVQGYPKEIRIISTEEINDIETPKIVFIPNSDAEIIEQEVVTSSTSIDKNQATIIVGEKSVQSSADNSFPSIYYPSVMEYKQISEFTPFSPQILKESIKNSVTLYSENEFKQKATAKALYNEAAAAVGETVTSSVSSVTSTNNDSNLVQSAYDDAYKRHHHALPPEKDAPKDVQELFSVGSFYNMANVSASTIETDSDVKILYGQLDVFEGTLCFKFNQDLFKSEVESGIWHVKDLAMPVNQEIYPAYYESEKRTPTRCNGGGPYNQDSIDVSGKTSEWINHYAKTAGYRKKSTTKLTVETIWGIYDVDVSINTFPSFIPYWRFATGGGLYIDLDFARPFTMKEYEEVRHCGKAIIREASNNNSWAELGYTMALNASCSDTSWFLGGNAYFKIRSSDEFRDGKTFSFGPQEFRGSHMVYYNNPGYSPDNKTAFMYLDNTGADSSFWTLYYDYYKKGDDVRLHYQITGFDNYVEKSVMEREDG